MDKINTPQAIKKNQQRNLIVASTIALIVVIGFYYGLSNHIKPQPPKDKIQEINLATPLTHVDTAAFWLEKAQNQLADQKRKQNALDEQLSLLKQSKAQDKQMALSQAQTLQTLKTQVALLQQQLIQRKSAGSNDFPVSTGTTDNRTQSDGYISDVTLQLLPNSTIAVQEPDKTPKTYVPAGTFVSAVTIGGADASAAVTSQGNPVPMLYRLTGEGTLRNNQHSHLEDCFATAAAIGDISSERGQVRLERLSCVSKEGNTVEIPVEATVFGPDGKNGVRGNALWREGALLERAFAAGTLSGLSNGISQSYTTTNLTPLGGQTSTVNNGKIMQYGLASGVGNAAEKLADYNIQRAEQYHPVIQLSAGTVVDIVFLKGFYLDGKKHADDSNTVVPPTTSIPAIPSNPPTGVNLPNNTNSNSAMNPTSPLPLTDAQIQALRQKNAAQGFN